MRTSDLRRSLLPVLGAGLIAVSLVACSAAASGEPTPAPAAPAPATPAPATPVPSPSDPGEDAMPITVVLDTVDGHDVDVDIVDYPGVIAGGASGQPGDGMSVEPYTVSVESVDRRTIKLTWVDFPIDNDLTLYVYRTDDGFRLVLIQPEPTEATDAVGFDRELLVTFEQDIALDDLVVEIQNGIDTPNS